MADWAQVVLVVGPAAVTGLTGYFIAHHQNQSAERRLKLQLDDAREREERQRKRDVRSAPLLGLREELAVLTQSFKGFVEAEQQRSWVSEDPDEPNYYEDIYQRKLKALHAYLESGSFERALFKLSDTEILKKANKELTIAFAKSRAQANDNQPWREQLLTTVRELQELVNERLEAL